MQCPFGGNHDLITWVSNHGTNRFWDMLGTDLPAIVSCIDVGPFKARNGSHIGQSIWRAGPHACLDSIELAAFLVQVRHFLKCLRSSLDPRFLGIAFFSKRTGLQLLLGYVVRSSNSTNVNSTVRTRIDLHYDDSDRKDMVENTSANMFPPPTTWSLTVRSETIIFPTKQCRRVNRTFFWLLPNDTGAFDALHRQLNCTSEPFFGSTRPRSSGHNDRVSR